MSEVWIHHARGIWYVTPDGMSSAERHASVWLRDVHFVIDPVGQERARRRQKPTTHAWAVGTVVEGGRYTADDVGYVGCELRYPWKTQDEFTAAPVGGAAFPVRGAKWLYVSLDVDGGAVAKCLDPLVGAAERRRVQQYGFER